MGRRMSMADKNHPTDLPNLGNYDPKEQMEIVHEIESILASSMNRPEGPEVIRQPRKKGVFFVAGVNSVLATMTVGLILLGQWYFNGRIEAQRAATIQSFSTEGQLVAKLMQKSRQELEAKNQEINSIQSQMEKLNEEKSNLVANFDNQINTRVDALKAQLQKDLEAERARLKTAGVSEAEITKQLASLEKSKTDQFNSALAKIRAESQAELDARTRELTELQTRLSKAQQEEDLARQALSKAASDRESALKSQLSDQANLLERLNKEKEAQNLYTRRLDSGLSEVRTLVSALDFPGAETSLNTLEDFLKTTEKDSGDNIKSQARSSLLLTGSLRSALTELKKKDIKVSDPRLENFRLLSEEALGASGEARVQGLNRALNELPELKGVTKAMEDIRLGQEERSREVKARQVIAAASSLGPEEGLRSLLRGLSPENLKTSVDQSLDKALGEITGPLIKNREILTAELSKIQELQAQLDQASQRNQGLIDENTVLKDKLTEAEAAAEAAAAKLAATPTEVLPPVTIVDTKALEAAALEAASLKETINLLSASNKTLESELSLLKEKFSAENLRGAQIQEFTNAYLNVRPSILALKAAPSEQALQEAQVGLAQALQTGEALGDFPGFSEVLSALLSAQKALIPPVDPLPIREQAFGEVLTATRYLGGNSSTASVDQKSLEELSRQDPQFRKVVESIQELSKKGIVESVLKTSKFNLYGTLVSFSAGRGVVEALTSAAVAEGQQIQLRTPGRTGAVLATGKISGVKGRRVEIEVVSLVEGAASPASGNIVYLEVP